MCCNLYSFSGRCQVSCDDDVLFAPAVSCSFRFIRCQGAHSIVTMVEQNKKKSFLFFFLFVVVVAAYAERCCRVVILGYVRKMLWA